MIESEKMECCLLETGKQVVLNLYTVVCPQYTLWVMYGITPVCFLSTRCSDLQKYPEACTVLIFLHFGNIASLISQQNFAK